MFIIINFVVTPQYKAVNQILVVQNTNKDNSNVQNSEVQANLQMVNTYSAMIKSPLVLDKVSEKLSEQYTVGELNKKIVTSSDQNSQVLNIEIKDESQAMAVKIANQTAAAFKENLPIIMSDKSVTIMSQAKVLKNAQPVSPNKRMLYALSIVLGLVLSGLVCFFREILDTTIKSEEQIVEKLDLAVLGVISKIPDNVRKHELINDKYMEEQQIYEK